MTRQERIKEKQKKLLISEHQHYDNWCSTFDFNYFYKRLKEKYYCTDIFTTTYDTNSELIENTVMTRNSCDEIDKYALEMLYDFTKETVYTLKHKVNVLTVKDNRIVLYIHPPYNKKQTADDRETVLLFEKRRRNIY